MNHFLRYTWPLFCLALLVCFSPIAVDGAKSGLHLWATVIVPTLFPFILLSNITIKGGTLAYLANHPNLRKWNPAIILSIFVGFLCGYPMGGKFVSDLLSGGFIDRKLANILLVLCNNASPMFIIGYVCAYGLSDLYNPVIIFFILYTPNIFLFLIRYYRYQHTPGKVAHFELSKSPSTLREYIIDSITTIFIIGVYMMLFSILITLLKGMANGILLLPIACLEVTVGIAYIENAALSPIHKLCMIVFVTAFGGFSSIMQTKSAAKSGGLSFPDYTIWKLFLAGSSAILAYVLLA